MTTYVIFQYVLMTLTVIFVGYPFILSILALFSRRSKTGQNASKHSFLIVIYAHNKEKEVSKTLYSLAGLVYPWNLYDSMVIADNCTDNTASAAKKLGAKVIEYNSSDENSSANIFYQAFGQVEHLYEKYDAIAFVKPDDLISGNFLEVMNYYLEEGSTIIQSCSLRFSGLTNWRARYKNVSWLLQTFIDALGRKKMGFGTIPFGSGTCFATDFLKNNPVKPVQVESDYEYNILLQEHDIKVDFAPEAVIWTPLDHSSAGKNRLNRSHGAIKKLMVMKKHIKRLTTNVSGRKLLQQFELLIWLNKPPLILLMALAIGNWIINLALWRLGFISLWFWVAWMILSSMSIIYLWIGIAAEIEGSPA